MDAVGQPFWSCGIEQLLAELNSSTGGLTEAEAAERRLRFGGNLPQHTSDHPTLRLLLRQLRSPIAILLGLTAILSAFAGEATDAIIILIILLGSTLLGFWQEYRAANVLTELLSLIRPRACVRRDGVEYEIAVDDIVPGDIVVLNAGDMVPADCALITARDLDVDEAVLTGESFPVSKSVATIAADAPLGMRSNSLFQGTHVVSGTAVALTVATGVRTVYGGFARTIERHKPESDFENGVRRFGYLLLEITAVLVLIVFAVNVALGRPVVDVFLFTLALAVGLTPQLLPAIVTVTLAHGARRMARRHVVVKRLVAIEDFGGMNVLCTDKTGTLTTGKASVSAALDASGNSSDEVFRLAYINASMQTGFDNPVDQAIRSHSSVDLQNVEKLDEVPYDFSRRRLSVLVRLSNGESTLITKGAVSEVLSVCRTARGDDQWRERTIARVADLSTQGLRCMALASKPMGDARTAQRSDEADMRFEGLIALADPPKADARNALAELRSLGVSVKLITGDHHLVASSVAAAVGLNGASMLRGREIDQLTEHALEQRALHIDVFAEIDPNQKHRIITALRRGGASVGYLGDGINDAAALQSADVGISVDSAVDVTRNAADIVLLRKDLNVLAEGVKEGRRAFGNTLKYVFVTTSANFGNMFSMAGASVLVPFLPMLPKQVLLLNLLSDLPSMAIATDRLDPTMIARPRRWDVHFIRNFMIVFGLISSVFDYLTFGALVLLRLPIAQFRTAWFVESVLTEIFVLLVIRTRRIFYQSPPSSVLLIATAGVGVLVLALPYVPRGGVVGFAPLDAVTLSLLLGITVLLLVTCEVAKRFLFRE